LKDQGERHVHTSKVRTYRRDKNQPGTCFFVLFPQAVSGSAARSFSWSAFGRKVIVEGTAASLREFY
jgi:hypothetical protein